MLSIQEIKKELIPVTLTNVFTYGDSIDGYLYQGKFIMKGLGNLNERLIQMLAIDIDFSIMEVIDREAPNLKVCSIDDNTIIPQWFYIKEE